MRDFLVYFPEDARVLQVLLEVVPLTCKDRGLFAKGCESEDTASYCGLLP